MSNLTAPVLRKVIDELCKLSWESGDIDGGDFQQLLERHNVLVEVPATLDRLEEWGSSTMLSQVWHTLQEHDPIDIEGEEIVCRWCSAPFEGRNEPCMHRLQPHEYVEVMNEYRWNPVKREWEAKPDCG